VASTFDIATQCQERGIRVIFRETYAQHFLNQFGGEFTSDYKKFPITQGRVTPIVGSCGPLIFEDSELINWRLRRVKSVVLDKMNILDQNNNNMCRDVNGSVESNRIDVVPAYASSALFWKAHFFGDCTHYGYFPGFYLPVIDGLYKVLFRQTLDFGKCVKVPFKSKYLQGPEGLKKGIVEGHDIYFLPNNISPIAGPFDVEKDDYLISVIWTK
jgi:hypothetical protein